MRLIFVITIITLTTGLAFISCKSSSGPATFCDTSCMKDTLKFTKDNNPLKPYVYISANNCMADTVIWSYDGMGANRKLGLTDLLGASLHLNKDFVRCTFNDTSYVWLLFNDCSNGRVILSKFPLVKKEPLLQKPAPLTALTKNFP